MKKGLIYYELIYPGKIHIDNSGYYFFDFSGQKIIVKLLYHVKVLNIQEYNNWIEYSLDNKPKGFNKQISNDFSKGSFSLCQHEIPKLSIEFGENLKRITRDNYYSHIIISHEVEDTESFSYDISKVQDIMNFFISIYRIASNDQYILFTDKSKLFNPLNRHFLYQYTKGDLKLDQLDRMVLKRDIRWSYNQLSVDRSLFNQTDETSVSVENISKKMKAIFESGKSIEIDEASKFLMTIDDKIHTEENHKMIFLELFIFIETIVSKFLRDKKVEHGVSNNKIKEYESEVSISYMLNVELPIFIQEITSNDRKTLGEIDKLRKKRNNIVHNGGTIDFGTLIAARASSMELFNLLRKN